MSFQVEGKTEGQRDCHDRYGKVPEESYRLRTCAMCFKFLFPHDDKPLQLSPTINSLVPKPNVTLATDSVKPDIHNSSAMQLVCDFLDATDCERWKGCCQAADRCCQRQQKSQPIARDSCPRTWDGFSCWDDTSPGVTATTQCPPYLEFAITSRKECPTPN